MFFDRTLTNPAITPGDGHRPLVVEGKDENDLGKCGEHARIMGFFALCMVRRMVRHYFRALGLILRHRKDRISGLEWVRNRLQANKSGERLSLTIDTSCLWRWFVTKPWLAIVRVCGQGLAIKWVSVREELIASGMEYKLTIGMVGSFFQRTYRSLIHPTVAHSSLHPNFDLVPQSVSSWFPTSRHRVSGARHHLPMDVGVLVEHSKPHSAIFWLWRRTWHI